ncbi:phage tail assembly protein [Palleronia caenipelagi]|uniref:Phage tail assembly protein n=1 Tax=Palleronia caenipelagi TaxID=2489174 RepID=A0A547PW59_9RHOB|nr:phage tail assembly protein [Palleronia caenipelagi]TRD18400.1 phage tail assembly protein [Palleronia caenipelagi]
MAKAEPPKAETKPVQPKPAPNTITLSAPVTVDGAEVTEITLREPRAGELRGLSMTQIAQMEAGQMMRLLPRITQPPLSEAQISALSLRDFFGLSAGAASFLVSPEDLKALKESR